MTAPKPPSLDGATSAASSAASAAASAASTATSALSSALPSALPSGLPSGADIGAFIREQRQHAKLSLRRLAKDAGVSNPYLSQVERGLRKPSAEILQQLAKGLRISAEQLYVQAGLLEERGTSQEVEAAIVSDPAINERQKRVLLDIYASFIAENRVAEQTAGSPTAATRGKKTTRKRPATASAAKKSSTAKKAKATKKTAKTTKSRSTRTTGTTRSKKSTSASNRSTR